MVYISKTLAEIWYDPENPAAFASADRLWHEGKKRIKDLKKTQVINWLRTQDVYTLHKAYRNRIRRNPIVAYSIDQCWFADLLDMSSMFRQNDGTRFLLVVVDVFSQFLFVEPLKNKKGPTVLEAFMKIRTDTGRMCTLFASNQV